MARCLILGGSDAGISAALRIRELDPTLEVAVLLRDAYPNYSICGLPFLVGIDRLGVFPFRSMGDGLRLQSFLELRQPLRAAIVGGVTVTAIEEEAGSLRVLGDPHFAVQTDLVLPAVGVTPETDLARSCRLPLGAGGAMVVNRRMETPMAGIWAAGENIAGVTRLYAGSLGTQVVKVFDQVIARTGLRAGQARSAGLPALTVPFHCPAHKDYLPGAGTLHFRLTGDRHDGRLLGAQLLGPFPQEVSKRLDVLATALFHGMTMETLSDLDLSYTPPLSSPWDPLQMAAQHWCRTVATGAEGG